MTKKTRYVGKESGKSSGTWFRNSNISVDHSEAGQHGHGARAGDGRTSNPWVLRNLLRPVFRDSNGKAIPDGDDK